jgi:hypothetical protein
LGAHRLDPSRIGTVGSLASRKTFNDSRRSERRTPVGPDEMSRIVEMHVERPAVGALEGLSDAARQVDIGSRNDHPRIGMLDGGDAIERVLRLFGSLLVTGEAEDLIRVLPGEIAVQCQDARRQPILKPAAGGTDVLFRRREIVGPLPKRRRIGGNLPALGAFAAPGMDQALRPAERVRR